MNKVIYIPHELCLVITTRNALTRHICNKALDILFRKTAFSRLAMLPSRLFAWNSCIIHKVELLSERIFSSFPFSETVKTPGLNDATPTLSPRPLTTTGA